MGWQPAGVAAADGAIRVRPGSHGPWNVARSLQLSFLDWALHHRPGYAECVRGSGMALAGRATLDPYRFAAIHRARSRDWISPARLGRGAHGDIRARGRRFAAEPAAGFYSVGFGGAHTLD